jgi:hypothetical protein
MHQPDFLKNQKISRNVKPISGHNVGAGISNPFFEPRHCARDFTTSKLLCVFLALNFGRVRAFDARWMKLQEYPSSQNPSSQLHWSCDLIIYHQGGWAGLVLPRLVNHDSPASPAGACAEVKVFFGMSSSCLVLEQI